MPDEQIIFVGARRTEVVKGQGVLFNINSALITKEAELRQAVKTGSDATGAPISIDVVDQQLSEITEILRASIAALNG